MYFEASAEIRRMAALGRVIGPLARFGLFRKLLVALIDLGNEAGPSAATRASHSAIIVAHALCDGRLVGRCTVRTPDPYDFTAQAAAAAVRSVLAGSVRPGCWPPSAVLPRAFLSSRSRACNDPRPRRDTGLTAVSAWAVPSAARVSAAAPA